MIKLEVKMVRENNTCTCIGGLCSCSPLSSDRQGVACAIENISPIDSV